jgi:hypothetical protein
MLDIKYEKGDQHLELCHGEDENGLFVDRMEQEIVRFLDENPCEILWFDIQTGQGKHPGLGIEQLKRKRQDVPSEEMKPYLRAGIDAVPNLKKRMFRPADWKNHTDWPTVQELVDKDQRVIMVVDNDDVSGDYGDGAYIFFRDNMTVENMYAVVDVDSCENRHGFNHPTFPFPDKELQRLWGTSHWTRIFTMNHFRSPVHVRDLESFKEDLDWDQLYPRIQNCIVAAGVNRKPNFIGADFIEYGDLAGIVNVLNWRGGPVAFFYANKKENDMKSTMVCGSVVTPRTLNFKANTYYEVNEVERRSGGDFPATEDGNGCANDAASSMVLMGVPAGTIITIYDSPDVDNKKELHKDDYAIVRVLQDIPRGPPQDKFTVSSFEQSYSNPFLEVTYVGDNGLNGKVSSVIMSGGVVEPRAIFYEGNKGTNDIVCTVFLTGHRQSIDFTDDPVYGCKNDEARSVVLVGVPPDTKITIYDGEFSNDQSWAEIETLQALSHHTIDSFEINGGDTSIAMQYHEKKCGYGFKVCGLDGKVTSVIIHY